MSSKVTFRARTVDSARALPIYREEELPDLATLARPVPALPSGMEKDEEAEKHLQDILAVGTVDSGMVIPTPECSEIQTSANSEDKLAKNSAKTDLETSSTVNNQYHQLYATEFKQPRQYIHVQPFSNQDIPDYDMDSEDIKFFEEELKNKLKFEVTQLCFENMIDRLEKNSTTNAVTIKEAKHILKEDDDLILLVYDYWLNKRLTNQQGLVPSVKSVNVSQGHNPYVCFRRRTEKMQTRKNRKNEEASYESMLKLRRDLTKVVTLLEMVKRREKTKKEKLNLTIDILDKRYSMKDFDGKLMDSAIASSSRYKFNNSINIQNWISISSPPQRKTYKSKRKHLKNGHRFFGDTYKTSNNIRVISPNNDKLVSSEDESLNGDDPMESNPFTFIRKEGVQYRAPLDDIDLNDEETDNISSEPFMLTGLSAQSGTTRCIGYCRRRLGRGGRVVMDRISTKWDDRWTGDGGDVDCQDPWMVRPLTPPHVEDMDWDPYMVRNQEEVSLSRVEAVEAGRMNNNNKMFKIVDMNKSLAHNAAGAIVDSQFVDLFSTSSVNTTASSKC